ncbi:heparinase II/III domain-containing protein [Catalinimonas niigatensis]|uniref:heparinase II/III domain-containing protein n=1 Tax=Catalinimonas niigatensis TaxID=1397264 RepID=UPI0026667CAE|nr:heparinase II/III family protein [Catalinimonas niigatensis]WPP48298.1 heparinase II/III family protein [Catalinimonas niigatensis]
MKTTSFFNLRLWTFVLILLLSTSRVTKANDPLPPELSADPVKLENPMSVQYLKKNLRKSSPRLILTPAIEKNLKKKLKSDPVVQNMYRAIQLNAQDIQTKPLLKRELEGRRLLATSREMLYRMNVLGMVYRMEKDQKILNRINDELIAVCNFQDWNPSHYLDVAEMAMAVAIAVDWAGEGLPESTVEKAKEALIDKGIMPSYNESGNVGWIAGTNNWNQVCNGGMIAASVAIAEKDPELASKTISRALDGIPHALEEYGPDGVYPEGSTYWGYGTSFSVLTSSMLESAFDTDFGIAEYPAFKESADFRLLSNAPSDWYYNFADCGDQRSENGDLTLAWFAAKTGNKIYFEKERFLQDPEEMGELARHAGAGLVWLSQFEGKEEKSLPSSWMGKGDNPLVFFRGGEANDRQYYFGGKGGRATISHGNMDAGSFIFELDGVRWVIDPGNQEYHELEKTGFNLWGNCQDCERWTLLTKNNYGHSTITVNDALHVNDGFAPIVDFKEGGQAEATIDMTAVFGNNIKSVSRRFVKENEYSILIEDHFELNDATQNITWQLMTTADVEIVEGGAILKQDGKQMKLENLSHPELNLSIISLDPPPLKLDRTIENLKRIEIRMPAYLFDDNEEGTLRVRLSSEK